MAYYMDTDKKLLEIFAKHCNLTTEEYGEIRGRFIDLVSDIQMLEEKSDMVTLRGTIEKIDNLFAIFEFLLNVKELTVEEYNELCDMVCDLEGAARTAVMV